MWRLTWECGWDMVPGASRAEPMLCVIFPAALSQQCWRKDNMSSLWQNVIFFTPTLLLRLEQVDRHSWHSKLHCPENNPWRSRNVSFCTDSRARCSAFFLIQYMWRITMPRKHYCQQPSCPGSFHFSFPRLDVPTRISLLNHPILFPGVS